MTQYCLVSGWPEPGSRRAGKGLMRQKREEGADRRLGEGRNQKKKKGKKGGGVLKHL